LYVVQQHVEVLLLRVELDQQLEGFIQQGLVLIQDQVQVDTNKISFRKLFQVQVFILLEGGSEDVLEHFYLILIFAVLVFLDRFATAYLLSSRLPSDI
jgi:hypothetical protein